MTHSYKGTAFIKIRLFDIFIYSVTLDNSGIFLLPFLHSSEMWSSKESFWSNLTPNIFSILLLVISKSTVFVLTVLFVLTNKYYLSALLFIKLSRNHLDKLSGAFCTDLMTPFTHYQH